MSHPKGYFQPGVLALSQAERVLYRWRCRPTRKNIGGALMRPTAPHVWAKVQAALAEPADAPDVPHDDNPDSDTRPVSWPLFVSLLVSNGWFIKPVPFDQRSRGVPLAVRQRNAIIRIPCFIAAWVAAFVLLPLWIPALAFTAWIVKITPGIRMINQSFQNVGPDEEPS